MGTVIKTEPSDESEVKSVFNCPSIPLAGTDNQIDHTTSLSLLAKPIQVSVASFNLLKGIGNLMYDKSTWDVAFITDTGLRFPANKIIIKLQSLSLFRLFVKKPGQYEEITISGESDDVFEEIMRFLYSTDVSDPKKYTIKLFHAAEKLQLTDLRDACIRGLGDNLNIENAAELLILADVHNIPDLKSRAIHFIGQNTLKVIETHGYRKLLLHQTLLMELSQRVFSAAYQRILQRPHFFANLCRTIYSNDQQDDATETRAPFYAEISTSSNSH